MNIKEFINNPKVKMLSGNQFKFLFDLYGMSDKNGIISNFTIIEFSKKAKEENNGNSTSRNSLAKYLQEFQELGLLEHNRYKKEIIFKF